MNFFLIYIGSYLDDETQADRDSQPLTRIEDYLTVNAQYSLRTATTGSYDSKVHDPRGRLLYAYARFAF